MGRKRRKKQKLNFLDIYQKIRQVWEINPKTRVKPSKKFYNRKREKNNLKKGLEND